MAKSLFLALFGLVVLKWTPHASALLDGRVSKQEMMVGLQRRIPLGRSRPSDFEERDESEENRDLQSIEQICSVIIDNYIGTEGVERRACQECRRDPNDPKQFIIECDFTNICSFCSPQNDVCYTLTHDYVVRPWRGDYTQNEDISYSACGIYYDGGEKVCLDETYEDWGYLATQCVSLDDVSCEICEINDACGEYWYGCANIEPGFYMDGCDYSINDRIPKDSLFVGFNYGLYEADTAACFEGGGNVATTLPPTSGPTMAPTFPPTMNPTKPPTFSPSMNPTKPPTISPTMAPTSLTMEWTKRPTFPPTKAPTLFPTVPSPVLGDSNVFGRDPSPTVPPSSSSSPTVKSSDVPSTVPSLSLSDEPSQLPSDSPSEVPSSLPSCMPSDSPSDIPSDIPSAVPTTSPSSLPSMSMVPSAAPSLQTIVVLVDFSIQVKVDSNTTLSKKEISDSVHGYLLNSLKSDFDNLFAIDLTSGEETDSRHRSLMQTKTVAFSGEAHFYRTAPSAKELSERELSALSDEERLHTALGHPEWDVFLRTNPSQSVSWSTTTALLSAGATLLVLM